jgi:hypothetical protein
MRKSILFLTGVVLCTGVSSSDAFDGQRKGFILGGGIGGGQAHVQQTLSGPATAGFSADELQSDRTGYGSVVTDFRNGGAFNNQRLLNYDNQVWWFNTENALGSEETFLFGIGLLGASYYFKPQAPCFYALATIGVATFGTTDDYSGAGSVGVSGGIGFELARHWSIEAVVGWGKPDESESSLTLETDGIVWGIRFVGIAY